jgi:hypothetical protein
LLLAAAAPLLVAFTRQGGIASFGDDSASYLVLARWMDGTAAPLVSPWVPMARAFRAALSAGARHSRCGAGPGARPPRCWPCSRSPPSPRCTRFVLEVTGRRDAAIAVAAVFMFTPTAWLRREGILSEPLYLAVSMEALRLHARRSGGNARIADFPRDRRGLGFARHLTRTVALALLAAYGMHASALAACPRRARLDRVRSAIAMARHGSR